MFEKMEDMLNGSAASRYARIKEAYRLRLQEPGTPAFYAKICCTGGLGISNLFVGNNDKIAVFDLNLCGGNRSNLL